MTIEITCEDCMDLMHRYPDGYFELAIVDPPYGSGGEGFNKSRNGGRFKRYEEKTGVKIDQWDTAPPKEYFNELFRVSKQAIIWGGNYFDLPPNRGFIVWDKMCMAVTYAQCEYAWTNIVTHSKLFRCVPQMSGQEKRIHPTQKPVKLYEWLLNTFAKPGDKILDTHLGSGSIAIACFNAGYSLVASEIDPNYARLAKERLNGHMKHPRLMGGATLPKL